MKKIFFSIFLSTLLFVSVGSITLAYQGVLPEIYISDVILDKPVYNPGDTIKGTFSIRNYDDLVATNIYYELILAGDYQDTVPHTIYSHSDMKGPLTLAGKEAQIISFEYKIPETLSGKGLGLQVQSMLQNGLGMGWGDGLFDVTGTSRFVSLRNASLSTSASTTKTYMLQVGPTVYKNEKAYLSVSFDNKNKVTQEVYPKLTIYDRSEARKTLQTKDEAVVIVKGQTVTRYKVELPVFDYVPRVYVGKLEFMNKEGQMISSTLDFRYIIDGQMITINNVVSDREYAKKGETVNLRVNITGSPFDINNREVVAATSTGSVSVKLFNELGHLVGEETDSKVDFNKYGTHTYPIEITEIAKTLKAEVKAFAADGLLLGEITADLTKNPMPRGGLITLGSVLFVIILLLILGAIGCLIKRRKITALILSLIAVVMVLGWWGLTKLNKAEAWVETSSDFYDARGDVSFFINYPQTDQIFSSGQVITVQAKGSYSWCGNVEPESWFSVSLTSDSGYVSSSKLTSVEGDHVYTYTIPNFALATTPGDHNLYGLFQISHHDDSGTGYQPYRIALRPPSNPVLQATCAANPNLAATGTPITWNATVSGGTAPYTYSWIGTDALTGSSSSLSKTYMTLGYKYATTTVRDSIGLTAITNCRANIANTTDIIEESCVDDIQNQDETGVDIGGICTADPACGDNAKTYDYLASSYPNPSAFCDLGSTLVGSVPAFPAIGDTVPWVCRGFILDSYCSASRDFPPVATSTLTVVKTGGGSGTVASNPAGISCGSDCSEVLNYGSIISLSAVADSGSFFVGWSGGGCSGTGVCNLAIYTDTNVSAVFEKIGTTPSGLSCSVVRTEPVPTAINTVNVNTNTVWELTSNPPCPTCSKSWTVNGVPEASTGSSLNKIFTTIGDKTITATISSSTVTCTATATTTVVQTGGGTEEI